MSSPITFSVVIPAYNVEAYIERAVSSALSQTCKPLEVVVVDDGSSDRTAEKVEQFGPPVRCIRQENQGVSGASNRGIKEAKGDYIALLDSDDEWLPHHLENARNFLEGHPDIPWYGSAYSEYSLISGRKIRDVVYRGTLTNDAYVDDFFRAQAAFPLFVCTDTVVIERQLFLDLGAFDQTMPHGEDRDLWFRIGLSQPRIGYNPEVSAIYWHRPDSLTGQMENLLVERKFNNLIKSRNDAREAGETANDMAQVLLIADARHLIFRAIRQNNHEVLAEISRIFGDKLGRLDHLAIVAGRVTPHFLIKVMAKIKNIIKG